MPTVTDVPLSSIQHLYIVDYVTPSITVTLIHIIGYSTPKHRNMWIALTIYIYPYLIFTESVLNRPLRLMSSTSGVNAGPIAAMRSSPFLFLLNVITHIAAQAKRN